MNIIIQIIVGIIIADILTGLFHWFEDTYLYYDIGIPIISEIAKDNEMHHYFPRNLLAESYLENCWFSLPGTIFIIFLMYLCNKSIFIDYPYFIASFAFFGSLSNIFHRFTHMRNCEKHPILIALQKTGLMCSHEHHSIHHTTEPDGKYCAVTNYTNYFLDSINFWRMLEHGIYLITGIQPSRKKGYDDYSEIQNHIHANAKLECPDKPTKQDIEVLKEKLKEYYSKGNQGSPLTPPL
jgi:hypothetical protein